MASSPIMASHLCLFPSEMPIWIALRTTSSSMDPASEHQTRFVSVLDLLVNRRRYFNFPVNFENSVLFFPLFLREVQFNRIVSELRET